MVAFKRRKISSWGAQLDEECAYNDDVKVARSKGEIPSGVTKYGLGGKIDRRVMFQKNNLLILARMSLVIGIYFFLTRRNHVLIGDVSNTISVLETDIKQMKRQSDDTQQELETVRQHFKDLERAALLGKNRSTIHEDTEPNHETRNISDQFNDKLDGQESKIKRLKQYIQHYHYLELERRFGPGPYYIEMKLIIKGVARYMTIQTAPNHLLPHTIYVFMDMVERKVWNNTIFLHQWNHKIQAKLIPPSNASNNERIAHPRSMQLSMIEYSEEYPHEAFTVGLSGRLGASELFINMKNNDNIYGSGKRGDGVAEDTYPCFAKVVVGKSTLALLNRATAEAMDQGPDGMIVTAIESMRIVNLSRERLKELGVIP